MEACAEQSHLTVSVENGGKTSVSVGGSGSNISRRSRARSSGRNRKCLGHGGAERVSSSLTTTSPLLLLHCNPYILL